MEGQRKPERPAECKALPARRCPYYIVRRSRCGFLTLLLSLYSRVSWASRFSSRSGDLRPPFVNVGDLEGPAPGFRGAHAPLRAGFGARPKQAFLPAGIEEKVRNGEALLPAREPRVRSPNENRLRLRVPSRRQGPDKAPRSVALQLTRRIPAPSPGESGQSKLRDREIGHGRA